MIRRAHWHYIKVDHSRKIVFIQDDNGPVSVTNCAEEVCANAVGEYEDGSDTSKYRLFYRDSNGNWDEMIHEDGKFIDFAPGYGVQP